MAVKNNVLELAKICPETNKSKGDTRPRVAILKEAALTKLNWSTPSRDGIPGTRKWQRLPLSVWQEKSFSVSETGWRLCLTNQLAGHLCRVENRQKL